MTIINIDTIHFNWLASDPGLLTLPPGIAVGAGVVGTDCDIHS